jgi:heterotetrameric sarcosine oxidase gamma subunit
MDRLAFAQPLVGKAPIRFSEVSVAVLAQPTLLELRGNPAEIHSHFPSLLPTEPNTTLDHGDWRAARLRPDGWWLLEAPPTGEAQSIFETEASAPGFLLTDISHSRACIRVSGAAARDTLAKGTPVDLRPNHFGLGRCATTWCAAFTVFIDFRDGGFDIYVTAPLAIAFWDWLSDAVEEFRA